MDKMLYIAMSGAKQNLRSLSINANNLANANTTGFKADLAQARSMQAFGEGLPSRVFAMTERSSQNFDNGAELTTGRSLDISVQGDGWIAVEAPKAAFESGAGLGTEQIAQVPMSSEAYTRLGQLRISADGMLTTSKGNLVLGEGGSPINIPLPISNITISSDGAITIQPEGAPSTVQDEVARIKFVNPNLQDIEKGHDGMFRRKDGEDADADITVRIRSGALEASNVDPIVEMSEMISLQRQFEMQLKLMKTAEEIDASSAALLRAF